MNKLEVCKGCGSQDFQTITHCTTCGFHVDIDMNKIMFYVVNQIIDDLNAGIDSEDLFVSVEEVLSSLQVVKNVLTDPDNLQEWRDLEAKYVPITIKSIESRNKGNTRDGRVFVSKKVHLTIKKLKK